MSPNKSPAPRFVGATELPWAEGTFRGPDAFEPDPAGRKGRWSLTGMAPTHAFYSAALLPAGGLAFDPVDLCWAENALPRQEAPFRLVLDKPLLKGLPPEAAHTVWACPKAHARTLFDFLDRVAVRQRDGVVWESARQTIKVVDHTLLAQLSCAPPEPPTVELNLWGWQAPGWTLLFLPPADLLKGPPCLVRVTTTPRPKGPGPSPAARRRPFTT